MTKHQIEVIKKYVRQSILLHLAGMHPSTGRDKYVEFEELEKAEEALDSLTNSSD